MDCDCVFGWLVHCMNTPSWLTNRTGIDPLSYAIFDAPKRLSGISLDLNESYWFWNEALHNELTVRTTVDTIGHYPDYTPLYKALAAYVGVPTEYLCVTNGSDQSIGFLITALAQTGGTAVIPAPTFLIYPHITKRAGIHTIFVPHTVHNNVYTSPLTETLDALTHATLPTLFLCNPNNPLGAPIAAHDMHQLLAFTHEHHIPVVIDEAYYEYNGTTHAPDVLQHDNIVVLRSFSKAFGMPGLRLGYTIAHPSVIHTIKSAKLPWNVNQIALHAGCIALEHQEYFAQKRNEVHTERTHLVQTLSSIGVHALESVCNFVTAPTPHAHALVAALADEHVYIKDVSGYPHGGALLEHAVRIAVPAPHDRQIVQDALLKAAKTCGMV